MTSYGNEEDYLRDQVRSNRLAIDYIQDQISQLMSDYKEDHCHTKDKIHAVYLRGVEFLKADSAEKRKEIKRLSAG